jgi:hypothetical protein
MEEGMRRIHLCLFCALLLTACGPAPQKVAESWQAALNSGDVDAALSYLAEEVSVRVIPPGPEDDGVYTGKEETRGWYETIVAQKGSGALSNCVLSGETLTCDSTYSDEGLEAMGVDFVEGSWVGVVRDGKIESYVFTMTPESLAKFPPQITEVRLTTPEEIAGIWAVKFNETVTILHDFKASGVFALTALGTGRGPDPSRPYPIGSDRFSFEGDLLHFKDAKGDCQGFAADYEVYGTYEDDRLVQLRFVLVGEDRCMTRKEILDGKTHLPYK